MHNRNNTTWCVSAIVIKEKVLQHKQKWSNVNTLNVMRCVWLSLCRPWCFSVGRALKYIMQTTAKCKWAVPSSLSQSSAPPSTVKLGARWLSNKVPLFLLFPHYMFKILKVSCAKGRNTVSSQVTTSLWATGTCGKDFKLMVREAPSSANHEEEGNEETLVYKQKTTSSLCPH